MRYRRTFIEDFDDVNSVGHRAGIYILRSSGSYLGIGSVQEPFLDCDETVYSFCTNTYPEVVFSVMF